MESSTENPAEVVRLDKVINYAASVAYMAQHGDVIVVDHPGVATQRLDAFAGTLRRAGRRTRNSVHVEHTGSGSLRVRGVKGGE